MSDPAAAEGRSVRGLTAFITGAGSGMGRATAQVFAADGAHVAVTDVNGEAAEAVAAELRAAGLSARAWRLDVSDRESIVRVIEEAAAAFGGIDALVNNAGIPAGAPIDSPA